MQTPGVSGMIMMDIPKTEVLCLLSRKAGKSDENQKNQKGKHINPAGIFEKLGSCRSRYRFGVAGNRSRLSARCRRTE